MAKAGIKLNKNWDIFARILDPKVAQPLLEKHVGRATLQNGMYLRKSVRQYMQRGVPIAEGAEGAGKRTVAPLTHLIKGGSKPLVGTKGADLFNAITYEQIDWKSIEVGVKRMSGMTNVAKIVHDGMTIKVTEAMRGLFYLLWLVDIGRVDESELKGRAAEIYALAGKKRGGRSFEPLKPGTTSIVIPPRRYLRDMYEDKGVRHTIKENWQNAVKAAIEEQAKQGRSL
jgi:hypothetical protein